MIDILVYLFENYADFSAHPEGGAIARKLSAIGFDDLDIHIALEWLERVRQSPAPAFVSHGMRIFTEAERDSLGEGCLDFLIFLERAGVIDAPLRELMLECSVDLPEQPLDLEHFKVILLMVLWSREQELDPLIVEELLAGSLDSSRYH